LRTTEDLFQKQLHAYTITHAIEDGTSCASTWTTSSPRKGKNPPKARRALAKKAVIEAILAKHDAATGGRRFNALLATASINDAIEYTPVQDDAGRAGRRPRLQPLNIACVFSPPAEGNKDVKQIQEDLPQERRTTKNDPEGKKAALKAIIADYNARYGTNHRIGEFDLYYQDVQKRIKDQQFPNADCPATRRRSTSPSWWTCCSPASIPST
jgi:type I restriction enzyme, R subunit